MSRHGNAATRAGLDGLALKPTECRLDALDGIAVERVTVDYEGREHLPDAATLGRLTTDTTVYVTAPVRADGFDPLGDDHLYDELPETVELVLVAGNPAYLSTSERGRAIAPRIGAAAERFPDAWVGSEGIERVALATGATQFELLSPRTETALRGLRAAGLEADLAVYAPTVLTDDDDAVLDALGAYVARRKPVRRALPEDAPTDSAATGRAREVLLDAASDYALVGDAETVEERVRALRAAGADYLIGYPARGLGAFRRVPVRSGGD